MYWKYPMNESNIINVLRVLVQSQGDFSSQDMDEFLEAYHGPPEGLEMLILHYPSIAEPYEASHESPSYPILATALRQFASDGSEWIAFIRQLVRKKIDLHARVPVHQWEGDSYHRTPLDILFLTTETPYESELAGASWLHVLADEGYSVNEYLKKEMALHDADLNLKIPWNLDSVLETPRRLKFKLGAKPRVLWDWWIDPQSPIYLLSEGFKTMVKTPDDYFFPPSWGRPWPYNDNYLAICAERDLWEPVGEQRKILYRITEDDNRRQRKRAAKVARARRSKGHRKIPGAWPM